MIAAIALIAAAEVAEPAARSHAAFEGFFKSLTIYLASGVEAAAGIVIGLAAIQATVGALLLFFAPGRLRAGGAGHDSKEYVRLRLGRWLALALEFELAADILRTAVAPTWNEIGQLAAIVVLRTALNYFLQKEIDKADQRSARPSSSSSSEGPRDVAPT